MAVAVGIREGVVRVEWVGRVAVWAAVSVAAVVAALLAARVVMVALAEAAAQGVLAVVVMVRAANRVVDLVRVVKGVQVEAGKAAVDLAAVVLAAQ